MNPATWLRSLSARLVLLNAALTMAFAMIMILVLCWLAIRFMSAHVDDAVLDEIHVLESEFSIDHLPGVVGLIHERLVANPEGHQIYLLVDADGKKLIGNLDRWPAEVPNDHGYVRLESLGPERDAQMRIRSRTLSDGTRLMVGFDEHEITAVRDSLENAAAVGMLATMLLGGVAGYLTSRVSLRHLETINRTAVRIIDGDLSQRVPLRGSRDEYDRLGQTLNEMLDRINELMVALKSATESIAHDLRTPLARLRNQLDSVNIATLSDHDRESLVEQLSGEVDRVLSVFASLLRLATIESGVQRTSFRPVPLLPLVNDAVGLYEALAAERDIAVSLSQASVAAEAAPAPVADADAVPATTGSVPAPLPELEVNGDRGLLFQSICNLLDNAVKFSPDGGRVAVNVETAGVLVRISIRDGGPGVPDDERERVFDRLVRLDSSRSTPGFGLGLSLVRAIARLHGGECRLHDGAPGTRAVLELPRLA